MNPRYKPFLFAGVALLGVWLLTFAAFRIADHLKMTPEKLVASVRAADLEKLNADERARRLRELAEDLNKLAVEDRRRARRDGAWDRLWNQMTEEEKSELIERTMPTGVKQMLAAFEKMSEDRRRFAITNAIARMRSREQNVPFGAGGGEDRDREPLSEELQQQVITTGLKTFYAESSAQTKAEVAPLLEEMQRTMQSGRTFRR